MVPRDSSYESVEHLKKITGPRAEQRRLAAIRRSVNGPIGLRSVKAGKRAIDEPRQDGYTVRLYSLSAVISTSCCSASLT